MAARAPTPPTCRGFRPAVLRQRRRSRQAHPEALLKMVAGPLMALVPLSLLLGVVYYGVPREPAWIVLAIMIVPTIAW